MFPTFAISQQSPEQSQDFVFLLNADEIRYEKHINPDAQRLIGNVILLHDSMYMYCDSALFNQHANSFSAYHNVRIEQGDTLFLYGDSLFYDGQTKLLRVRDNVRLENTSMVLLTDSLNFDRNTGLGWFFHGGTLLDGESTLISQYGQFDTNTKLATFIDGVSLENPDYKLFSDTLLYNSDLHLAVIESPTQIKQEEASISTNNALFNTDGGKATLLDRSVVLQDDGRTRMTADSLVMDKNSGILEGFGNVIVNYYTDSIDVSGDYAFYDNESDSAVVTDNSLLVQYQAGDTLFLHADTISMFSRYNATHDTLISRYIRAFNKVRAYRYDLQAVADSLSYSTADSCLNLFGDPIVWTDNQQVLGEVIHVYMNDSTVDWAHVLGQALFVQQIDTLHFNQIAGREMKALFKLGHLDKTVVKGNVETVFYAMEDDSVMIGMNTLVSSNLTSNFKDGAIDNVFIEGKSNGIMYPMSQLEKNKMYLATFDWFDWIRPLSGEDVFYWRGKRQDQILKKSAMSKPVPLPTLKK